jgi:hypothetical protein
MKKYEAPVIDITNLLSNDVITTSPGDTPDYEMAW